MPGRDRTGPWGMGPMTGRGMGWCRHPGTGWAPGAGFGGFGWPGGGRGRGWRNRFHATGIPAGWKGNWCGWSGYSSYPPAYPEWSAEAELQGLKEYASTLEQQLNALRARVTEIEKEMTQSAE